MEKTGFGNLYEEKDRETMRIAEDSLDPKVDRVAEIMNFAREGNIKRIGIANCITFEKEAQELEHMLLADGFEVVRANCKYGRMPNEEILPGYKGISCNPAGQADFLKKGKSELNIVMGLCLGHDMVFNAKSHTLTTALVVKDRKLGHHTLEKFNKQQI